MSDRDVTVKLQQLRSYIPFVERMIRKLEPRAGPDKNEYLEKLRGLHGFLTSNPDARRISYETLIKMEKIIKGLYESAGRSGSSNSGSVPRSFGGKLHNMEPSFDGPSSYAATSRSLQSCHDRRVHEYDSTFSSSRSDQYDNRKINNRRPIFDSSFSDRRNVVDVDYRSRDCQSFGYSNDRRPFESSSQAYYKKNSCDSYRKREYEENKFSPEQYSKDFSERKHFVGSCKSYDDPQQKFVHANREKRNEASSSQSSKSYSHSEYIKKEKELFGEDIFGEIRHRRQPILEPPIHKRNILDLPMPPVKPFNRNEYLSSKQTQSTSEIGKSFSKTSEKPESIYDSGDDYNRRKRHNADLDFKETINTKLSDLTIKNIPESQTGSKSNSFPERINNEAIVSHMQPPVIHSGSTTDTPQSPEIEAKFSPVQSQDDDVKDIPLEKNAVVSKSADFHKDACLMENIKKAINFLAGKPSVEKPFQSTFGYEDFVGPAGHKVARVPKAVGDACRARNIFGNEDMDLRKVDVDLRQLPKAPTISSESKHFTASKWANSHSSKDVDMGSLSHLKSTTASLCPSISRDTKVDLHIVNKGTARSRVAHDSDKLIKLGKKGVAATQMDDYKQKRELRVLSKSSEGQAKAHQPISLLDELLPITETGERKSKVPPTSKSVVSQVGEGDNLVQSKNTGSSTDKTVKTATAKVMGILKKYPINSKATVPEGAPPIKDDTFTQNASAVHTEPSSSPNIVEGNAILAAVADLPSAKGNNKVSKTVKSTSTDGRSETVARDPRALNKEPPCNKEFTSNVQRTPFQNSKELPSHKNVPMEKGKLMSKVTPPQTTTSQPAEVYPRPLLHPVPRPLLHPVPRPLMHPVPRPLMHPAPRPLMHPAPRPRVHQSDMRFNRPPFPRPMQPVMKSPLLTTPRPPEIPRFSRPPVSFSAIAGTQRPLRPPIPFPSMAKNTLLAESFTCVILKGLPPYVNSRNIYRFFEHYLLRDLCIVLDSSLNCKGEAYVHFASHADAADALESLCGGFIDNYRIFIGMCSVGILRQAKNTYGHQNIERERILKVSQKPGTNNWNPFYKLKPAKVAEVLKPPPEIDNSVTYSSPIDRPELNPPEVNLMGYSNMCGVKMASEPKDMKKFKIPKVKKPDSALQEKSESKEEVLMVHGSSSAKSSSSNDELTDIIPISKRNRRYRKIKHVIQSDSDSDNDSPIPEMTSSKVKTPASLIPQMDNPTKMKKKVVSKNKAMREKFTIAPKAQKKGNKGKSVNAVVSSVRKSRSQVEKETVVKADEDHKITRQTVHIESVDEREVTVIIPVPDQIAVSLVEGDKIGSKVGSARRGRGKKRLATHNLTGSSDTISKSEPSTGATFEVECDSSRSQTAIVENKTDSTDALTSDSLGIIESEHPQTTLTEDQVDSNIHGDIIPDELGEALSIDTKAEEKSKALIIDTDVKDETKALVIDSNAEDKSKVLIIDHYAEDKSKDLVIDSNAEDKSKVLLGDSDLEDKSKALVIDTNAEDRAPVIETNAEDESKAFIADSNEEDKSNAVVIDTSAEDKSTSVIVESSEEDRSNALIIDTSAEGELDSTRGSNDMAKDEEISFNGGDYANDADRRKIFEAKKTESKLDSLHNASLSSPKNVPSDGTSIEKTTEESNKPIAVDDSVDTDTISNFQSSDVTIESKSTIPTSECSHGKSSNKQMPPPREMKFASLSSQKSVFDKDDDLDAPDLTRITPSISNDFVIYSGAIAELSDINKESFIPDQKNTPESEELLVNKTDLENINEISDQLVQSANEFTLSHSLDLSCDAIADSDEENNFSETVDALVDSLSETVSDKDHISQPATSTHTNNGSTLQEDVSDAQTQSSVHEEMKAISQKEMGGTHTEVGLSEIATVSIDIAGTTNDDHSTLTKSAKEESIASVVGSLDKNVSPVITGDVEGDDKCNLGRVEGTKEQGTNLLKEKNKTAIIKQTKPKIIRKSADSLISQNVLPTVEIKRLTRSSKVQIDQQESATRKVFLRSPTLVLRDISADVVQKDDTPGENSEDDTGLDNESSHCSLADDDSIISSEGRVVSLSPETPAAATSKKPKRGKMPTVNQKKRITRGSMVIPEIKEDILWDDGGVVDLFLCDQCDYVGKQQVFHLINFHSEREVPCVFRKEDFSPVLRDPIGPPKSNENSIDLDICWIPTQMSFDEEIECQEDDCDYYSSSRFDFIYHLLEHNPESIDTFFHCRLCNYMSNQLIGFYDHVTSHTGEYRHACVRCGQKFFSMEALNLHHSDQHPKQADDFSSADPILEDGWPYIYVCKVCQYAQISKDSTDAHIRNKHNGKAESKKANMTRQIKVWEEKKKEEAKTVAKGSNTPTPVEAKVSPRVVTPKKSITPSKEDVEECNRQPDTPQEEPEVTILRPRTPQKEKCRSSPKKAATVKTEVIEPSSFPVQPATRSIKVEPQDSESSVKNLHSINCDKSVFLGSSEVHEAKSLLPPVIASNLTIKKLFHRPKVSECLLDDILKKIGDDLQINNANEDEPITTPGNEQVKEDEQLSRSSLSKKIAPNIPSSGEISTPTPFSPPRSSVVSAKSPVVCVDISSEKSSTVPVDVSVKTGLKRPFSALNESPLMSPIRRDDSFNKESSDCDSDYLVIDEQKDLEETDKKVAEQEDLRTKFMRTSSGQRVSTDNVAESSTAPGEKGGFLRIESCITLDPKAASNIFGNNSTVQSTVASSTPVTGQKQPTSIASSSVGSSVADVSAVPSLGVPSDSVPTVPLQHIFIKYQQASIFSGYISDLASMVFKCMNSGCSFTTDCANTFDQHLHQHLAPQFRCCYCLCAETSYQSLIQHILMEHSHCDLQCRYCLYRAHTRVYIGVHLKKFHPEKEARFMKVNTIRSVPPPCPPIENFVYPYKCSSGECLFKTVDSDCFSNHVRSHDLTVPLPCYLCQVKILPSEMVKHMKIHMMNEFQCPYCLFGVEEREQMLTHLLNRHPGRQGRVLLRKQELTNASFDPAKSESQSPSRKMSTDSDSSSLLAPLPFSGLNRSPSMGSPAQNSQETTGLTGHTLYRCGNEKCVQSCPTQYLLKEHLHICDFSRDSPLLKCFHCFKTFRHLSGLLDHIKVHGLKRYSCGSPGCDYRGPLAHYFKNHMKQMHHSSTYKIVPKDFTNKDPETQEFIVYPKDALTNVKEPHRKKKNEYSTDDIDKIPRSHVCYNDLKCYHCPYTSKIRLNLIKHLKLHKRLPAVSNNPEGESVPVRQPVNPVPCLNRTELMFDKMKNLAGSSFVDSKVAESVELRIKHPIPADEITQIPIYVVEDKINKCGIEGCNYVSCDEVMLKYHINTLHTQFESWLCPHCPNFRLTLDKISPHFKLHGQRLYRCGWCSYLTTKQSLVDRHMKEKHADKKPFTFPIRTTESDDIKDEDDANLKPPNEPPMQWQCGLCVFRSVSNQEMVNHTTLKHDMKSQYKCGYCNVRSSVKTAFDGHFAAKHPHKEFRVLCIYYRLDSDDIVPVGPSGKSVGHQPLWRRNDPDRPKQMGGILIDDKSGKELSVLDIEPGEPYRHEFVCPKCHSFKTPCPNTFRLHLGKEANYQRFECSDCGITSPLLPTIRRHYTKTHGEFTADCYLKLPVESHLEAWVESIVSYQEHKIKQWLEKGNEIKPDTKAGSTTSRRSSYEMLGEPGTSGKVLHSSGQKYVCDTCGLECRSSSGLKTHVTAMHQTKFKCQYCPFHSNLEEAVLQHCSSKHPSCWNKDVIDLNPESGDNSSPDFVKSSPKCNKKTHTCPHCGITLASYKIFLRHKKSHSVRKFGCHYCRKKFKSKPDAKMHMTKFHAGQPQIISCEDEETDGTPDEASAIEESATPTSSAVEVPAVGEYSCCHCSDTGSMQTVQEHMKVNHRELPYLVRYRTATGLYLEVHRFTCGHCSLENVTLLEAMNHWLKVHVALDFAFKVTLFSSSLIPQSTETVEKPKSKGVKRKMSRDIGDNQSPKRKQRSPRTPRTPKAEPAVKPDAADDNGANQVSSSTNESAVDMVIKCGYCPLTFNSNNDTVKHIKKVHGENKPIKMQMLEKDEYEKSHKGMFECNHCGESGAVEEIHRHTLEAHPQMVASFKKITRAASTNLNQRFICTVCRHSVKSKRAIYVHIVKKHASIGPPTDDFYTTELIESPSTADDPEAGTSKQNITCGYCSEVLASMIELREHNEFLHSHLPLKYNVDDAEPLCIASKKNTARKSFATSGKRQFATKSTGGRLQILHHRKDPLSSPEVYLDYAERE